MERVNILGVGVSAINMRMALSTIDDWIGQRQPHYVCVTGMHGIMESQHDDTLRQIHNAAGLVTPDGMSLVRLMQLHGIGHVERVYGPDLMLAVCAESVHRGYRHYLFGTTELVLDRLSTELRRRFPGIQIVGCLAPPFRPVTQAEDADIVESINGATPDIVWVSLSTPKQERWVADHVLKIDASVLIGVGAAFDFIAGTKPQAPRWMQRSGLEWAFRVLTEPRRLGRRYLVNIPLFLGRVVLQALGLKRYSLG